MRVALVLAVVLVSGCAWIGGGCELAWGEKRASCQPGGSIVILAPARMLEAVAPNREWQERAAK